MAEELRLLSFPLQRVWAPSLVGGTKIPHTVWCGQNFQEKLSKGRNNFISGLSDSNKLTSSLDFFRSQWSQNLLVFTAEGGELACQEIFGIQFMKELQSVLITVSRVWC